MRECAENLVICHLTREGYNEKVYEIEIKIKEWHYYYGVITFNMTRQLDMKLVDLGWI